MSLNDSDDEVNTLFGITEKENNAEPSISVTQGVTNRREKIAEFLKDSKEKKMTSRCSIEKQQLTLMKEDLSLKRKLSETTNSVDQQFLQNNNKMIKTMENLGNAVSNCVDLMKRIHDSQQALFRENYGRPPVMPMHSYHENHIVNVSPAYGSISQYYPSNCFNTCNLPDSSDDQHD